MRFDVPAVGQPLLSLFLSNGSVDPVHFDSKKEFVSVDELRLEHEVYPCVAQKHFKCIFNSFSDNIANYWLGY